MQVRLHVIQCTNLPNIFLYTAVTISLGEFIFKITDWADWFVLFFFPFPRLL